MRDKLYGLRFTAAVLTLLLVMLLVGRPLAWGEEQEEPTAPSLPTNTPESEEDARIRGVEEELAELRDRLNEQEAQQLTKSPLSINGYIDFGFFAPNGNDGAGWRRDAGNAVFPQYSDFSWTFYGDLLATSVNSRGEVADLGDAPGIVRFDSVNANGAPGFIVNEVNFRLEYQVAEQVLVRSSVNFVPRSSSVDFDLGDFLDLDLAEVEYIVTPDGSTSIFAGKMLPVFGIEYKERRADQRFGVTPTLMHRYTSGSQLGLKVRSKLFENWLIIAAGVSNNSSTTEQFHFYSEIDQNWGKTLNGRLAVQVPIGELIGALSGDTLEVGFSGEWGPQDRASNNSGAMWFIGADLTYSSTNFALKAQWMKGEAPGRPEERVWALDLRDSGYAEIDWMILPYLGVLVRADIRDAVVTLAKERIYISKTFRVTGGLRGVLNPHVALKAEYLHNREFDDVPEFSNDVFVSSLVLSY